MNTQNTGLGLLLPALLNPATATVLAIGVVGFGLVKLLAEEETDEDTPFVNRSAENRQPSKPSTQPNNVQRVQPEEFEQVTQEPSVQPLRLAVAEPEVSVSELLENELPAFEDKQRELIRQYMSVLGKRSAAARAKKRKAVQQGV